MLKIVFITGARSEYGIMKPVIQRLTAEQGVDVTIMATGMHLLATYGATINEIYSDDLAKVVEVPAYSEENDDKCIDFQRVLNSVYNTLKTDEYDVVYLIGDRIEAYASALAAHFLHIPIIHYAGGQLTLGAVDNIYRYNISNLATHHLVTNLYAVERLKCCPAVNTNNIHFVGSSAVDAIMDYLKSPVDASIIDERLTRNNFVLMTFHSETNPMGHYESISSVMENCIRFILSRGIKILITYPNNDNGCEPILKVIDDWHENPNVIIVRSLGAYRYYVASDNCLFVVGNSSSGIIEIPYFAKYTINIGERQKGRNAPNSVISLPSSTKIVLDNLEALIKSPKCDVQNAQIYGDGHSIEKICNVILSLKKQ